MTIFRMHGIADGICLAASPAFALMALLAALAPSPDMMCMAAPDRIPVGGMVLMYIMMSAFHAGPWLRLIALRQTHAGLDYRQETAER